MTSGGVPAPGASGDDGITVAGVRLEVGPQHLPSGWGLHFRPGGHCGGKSPFRNLGSEQGDRCRLGSLRNLGRSTSQPFRKSFR